MDGKCAEWIQDKTCECVRKVCELEAIERELVKRTLSIGRKIGLLNEWLVRVKERVHLAQDALNELSAVAGVEYKLDLPDIESDVKKLIQDLCEKEGSFDRKVGEIDQ